jgi:hypothetical protein
MAVLSARWNRVRVGRLFQFAETWSRRDMTKPDPATNSLGETEWPAKAGFFVFGTSVR